MDDFNKIIEAFNDNKYLRNKLINSLFNNNLFKNDSTLINKLINKISNLGYAIDSKEILLNIIMIYNDKDEVKKILNRMEEKNIAELLEYIKDKKTQYLNFINRFEVIFGHIIENNIEKYKNNDDIKNALNQIFLVLIEAYKGDIYNKKDSVYQNSFNKCIIELISIIAQINNLSLKNEIFEKIKKFLEKIKNEDLVIDIFKSLFFELYETKENLSLYLKNSKKLYFEKYSLKQIDSELYNYLSKIIELKFEPKKEIIIELLFFLEKIYIDYEKNKGKKNYIDICRYTHIFNSKKIIGGIFDLLIEYQKKAKIELKNEFNNYEKLISFLFCNIQSPAFIDEIIKNLKDEKIFLEKIIFFDEIIKIISLIKEDKKDMNKNKIIYQNSIEILEIFYLSNKHQNLFRQKEYENIFIKYYNYLKENNILFSQYIIPFNDNKKTILEYCFDLSIQFGFDNFQKLFDNAIINNYILRNKYYKEKDYDNDTLNKFLKSLKFKLSEKPIILHIIEILISKINKEKNYEKNLNIYIDEIKKNNIWKKYEKENEEFKIVIKNLKNNELTELINYFNNKKETKEIQIKNEPNKSILFQNINENDCPLKKNCFLLKNKTQTKTPALENSIKNMQKLNSHNKIGTFSDLDLNNIILCIKRDLLLKECSAYFYDIYFEDNNFKNIKKLFLYKYKGNKKIKLENNTDKLNHPVELKNYSNNNYAYPQIYFRPYTSFYNNEYLKISHSYFDKNVIKKPSFPYFLSHYNELKSIFERNKNKIEIFNEETELIMKTKIICGNLIIYENVLFFINNYKIKDKYDKDIKYLFSSLADDLRDIEKIIIIRINDIEEIITRRFLYDYRAFEIFLKNGKSYYFNLYKPEILELFFSKMNKYKEMDNRIISNPKKCFNERNYYNNWVDDNISTYQYLLYINKFSSRSYNDINQYPIFPWIFRELALGSHKGKETLPKFRDLEYPISLLGNSKEGENSGEDLEDARLFFDASLEENRKHPSHFRLHYSTSGYILSFMVRISPYTEEQIRFQNNQFDSPSRQLNSIDEILTILSNSHDNRELIPEYFTTEEFYLNMNYIYFGFRLNDKILINDVKPQDKYFKSIAQYVYYNRLVLNIRFTLNDLNKPWFDKELKINSWIDLIFGVKQWSDKPKRNDLNLFGKYSYKQYINFDKKMEKYKLNKLNDDEIIGKIKKKKLQIINFGQCPEVLFNKAHAINYLKKSRIAGDIKGGDDFDILSSFGVQNIFNFEQFEKEKNKSFNIVDFWVTDNGEININDYIYFLTFEGNNVNELYIFIYKDENNKQYKPKYIIKIEEINLFSKKKKLERKKRSTKKLSVTDKDKEKEKEEKAPKENKENDNSKKEIINYYNYTLSPKNCIMDICCTNRLYFFVGRNIDNSLKIYEIDIQIKEKEGKLKYNIPMDSFVSCIYKKDKNSFFTGHKNGKILEWKITYNKEDKKEKIINIEIIRDIIAHKDSMVCCINYIEKHNIIISSSFDGKLFIRKYYDFELLSTIQTQNKDNIIKFVYTDYDLLYILVSPKQKNPNNKSYIYIYTLNGVLVETSSEPSHIINIEPMKNGKIFFNTINSTKLGIFGFNEPKGSIEEYDILKCIDIKPKEERERILENKAINNFTLKLKNDVFYILLENKYLFRQMNTDFSILYKGIKKLSFFDEQIKEDNKDRKLSVNTNDFLLKKEPA